MGKRIKGGYYLKARCIRESAIAHSAPCVRELWDYLLREANHRDVKYNGFTIKRGQLFRSYRQIRDDLSWHVGYRKERYSENQMKKGMKHLAKELMITTTKKPRGVLITISNYDYFQNPENYEGTNEGTTEGTTKEPRGNQRGTPINKNEKNEKNEKEISMSKNGACPQEKIKGLYHEILPTHPRIKIWNNQQQSFLRARWRESTEFQHLDWWRKFFKRVQASDFLSGRTAHAFIPDLEWLVKAGNFARILNGRYDNRGSAHNSKFSDITAQNIQSFESWAPPKKGGL